jgi:large subunit ribosomal protein L25
LDLIELKADIRKTTGKGTGRVLRREGRMPGILYGPGTEPILLSVNIRDLENILKKKRMRQVLLNLVVQNGESTAYPAMIKELQTSRVSRSFLHADFYKIATDRKIRTKVPVVTKGKPKGVELGGMLQIIRRELEILCYPHEMPDAIEIDITNLGMGESVHVKDIPTSENVEIPADVNFTVVTILTARAEKDAGEEKAEGEEEETAEPAEKK